MMVSHPHSGDAVGLGEDFEKALAFAMKADDNVEQLAHIIAQLKERVELTRRDALLEVAAEINRRTVHLVISREAVSELKSLAQWLWENTPGCGPSQA